MNKRLNCLIADDEPLARQLLKAYLTEFPQLCLKHVCINGKEAQEALASDPSLDLLFLDIQMPRFTGLSLVEHTDNLPMVIFTTAYENHAAKAFELQVVDYLLKPFSLERFEQAVGRALDLHQWQQSRAIIDSDEIWVKTEYQLKKILRSDICYVEARKEYVKIFTRAGDFSLVYMRMKEMETLLGEGFMRIHRSFIVNLTKVEAVLGDAVLVAERSLPVSRKYVRDLKSRFKES